MSEGSNMKIAVYFDDKDLARKALAMAESYAMQSGADFYVLSTITRDTPLPHSEILEHEEELDARIQAVRNFPEVRCQTRLLVDAADPGEQIVKFVKRKQIDWLYLAVPGRSRLARLVGSSTALHVILNAACPVVTINEQTAPEAPAAA